MIRTSYRKHYKGGKHRSTGTIQYVIVKQLFEIIPANNARGQSRQWDRLAGQSAASWRCQVCYSSAKHEDSTPGIVNLVGRLPGQAVELSTWSEGDYVAGMIERQLLNLLLPSSAEGTTWKLLAWVPARGVAKWHSVDRHCTWFRSSVEAKLCEFEWSFRSRWRWIIKRETNSAYRRVVLRVVCVFTGISNFRYMVGLFDCLQ